jgi:ParB family chromosome partitioning protein
MKRFMADPNSIQADQSSTTVLLTAIELPVKRQPRRYFDLEKMSQLVASVREHGNLLLGSADYEQPRKLG